MLVITDDFKKGGPHEQLISMILPTQTSRNKNSVDLGATRLMISTAGTVHHEGYISECIASDTFVIATTTIFTQHMKQTVKLTAWIFQQ